MGLITKKQFAAGELIYNRGDEADYVFLLNEGQVFLFEESLQGEDIVSRLVKKGQVFGEMALTSHPLRRFKAVAKSESLCVCISVEELTERVDQQDPFVAALFRILVANFNSVQELSEQQDDMLDIMIGLADDEN